MQCGREQEHIKVISILKYMEEMLFVSCFKGPVHSVGEKSTVSSSSLETKGINWNLLA